MILNNFGEILIKRKELKPLFKIFIKHFQQEIAFIEQIIEHDAEEMKKEASCCYCITRKINCFKKKVGNRFEMFNQVFYKVFNEMSPTQRQDYFLELLTFIQVLGNAYQEYLQKHKVKEDFQVNKYKTHITTIMFQKFVQKDIVKQIEVEQQNQVCLQLMVKVDGKESQKVGRFKDLKFQLIEKIKGIETQIFFNVKNYLPINIDSEALTIKFSAIYQTIKPVKIELCFKDPHSQKKFEKYIRIFTELMKVGKIQKLVRSIDIFKIFGKNIDQNKDLGNTNSLMKTFVSQEQYQSIHEKNYVDSEDIMRSNINFKKRFQRLETIKKNRYQQVKRKLIETLNVLAEKKEKQKQKVKQFLRKSPIKVPKSKSQAVIRALNSTQALNSRKINNIVVDVSKDLINRFLMNPQESNQKLSIINGKKSLKQTGMPKHRDSFIESDGNKSFTSQKFQKMFQISSSKSIKLAQSYQNIYIRLYPQYIFSQVESLMDMIKIDFKPLFIVPDQALLKQANNLSGEKLSKFKINWLDKLNSTLKLYCRKKNQNFIKVFIPFPIQLKSLVQALVNVENYPKWHPNIKKSEIISILSSQNMITYRMDVLNPVTNKIVSIQMIMHLFKYERKYYIIQKSANSNQSNKGKNKGWFNIFNKSSNSYSSINFLMMRLSNINKNGFCEMATTIDYEPLDRKNSQKANKQIITIFSNFAFIANYWKQSEKERKFNPSLFDYDWTVSKKSFDQKQQNNVRDVFFDNIDDFMNKNSRIIEKNQQKGNGQSSSELIHSSQFYDL